VGHTGCRRTSNQAIGRRRAATPGGALVGAEREDPEVTAPPAPSEGPSYQGVDDPPLQAPPVDALLLVSFGGPEAPEHVLPFMENVTRGRGIPPARLEEVSRHYLEVFGGVSPINAQARALKAALEAELAARGPALPVYWGNRNWHPFLAETLAHMRGDGVRHALAVVTSAFPSYSGCRQYREDWWRARREVGAGAPLVSKLRHYWAEDGFLDPVARGVQAELAALGPQARLVFCAHSIPLSMAASSGPDGDGYVRALTEAAARVVARLDRLGHPGLGWDLVWQSRSGPPQVPWLEPDVGDHLEALHAQGVREAVMVPIGFTSDHVEVLYDLDLQAQERVAALPGMTARRSPTVGTDPQFVGMLRDLVVERLEGAEQPDHGALATHDRCPAGCCPPPARRPARSAG
jgi:protoporphyrin/coproporphyrin ferrochelatase